MKKTIKRLSLSLGVILIGTLPFTLEYAEALILSGGFGLSGIGNLSPFTGFSGFFTGSFSDPSLNQTSGSLTEVVPPSSSSPADAFSISDITFTLSNTGARFYEASPIEINFGQQTIGGITDNLVFYVDEGVYLRTGGKVSASVSSFNPLSAYTTFGGNLTEFEGAIQINDTTTGDGTFALSFTALPSPSVTPPNNTPPGNQGAGPGNTPPGNQGAGPGNTPPGNQGAGPGNTPPGNQGAGPGNTPPGNQGAGPGNTPPTSVVTPPVIVVPPNNNTTTIPEPTSLLGLLTVAGLGIGSAISKRSSRFK
ncbi:protein of unknown function DUF1555 [Rippkaea orientalis PCC 8801]|uniref:PEP-CTERM protein-sorting domain-containing protein n=1 Tax=Rippkaea orientalis (strain PCC 8801 / RF-1) TaxID=41431 RepID=B7K3W1_RIPO1|nr:PEP-CTERM sorting domain-containing protein [Rippkaea orientalis]ACK66501.1 protein of unknown function DUF1555 [Rippkaea orientalis PCC 8801]